MTRGVRAANRGVKRAVDVLASAVLFVALLPAMAAIAILVWRTSPGPVIFTQRRIGRGGAPFTILKFRTMTTEVRASDGSTRVYEDDPRITPVGRVLRRTSLDELPQLINVLRGEMSLVGPRPDLPHHVERYTPRQRRRLEVPPGITGWAQIAGRNDLSWDERIELDLEYVESWSLRLDARILVGTIAAVVTGKGAGLRTGEKMTRWGKGPARG